MLFQVGHHGLMDRELARQPGDLGIESQLGSTKSSQDFYDFLFSVPENNQYQVVLDPKYGLNTTCGMIGIEVEV